MSWTKVIVVAAVTLVVGLLLLQVGGSRSGRGSVPWLRSGLMVTTPDSPLAAEAIRQLSTLGEGGSSEAW